MFAPLLELSMQPNPMYFDFLSRLHIADLKSGLCFTLNKILRRSSFQNTLVFITPYHSSTPSPHPTQSIDSQRKIAFQNSFLLLMDTSNFFHAIQLVNNVSVCLGYNGKNTAASAYLHRLEQELERKSPAAAACLG